jgi:SOS-response transcriptional repressor LexA
MPEPFPAAIITTKTARYSILSAVLPEGEFAAGVLLEDPAQDRVYLRLRRDWDEIAPQESEVLSLLEADLANDAARAGAAAFFANLEAILSNTLRISERREVKVADFERGLARLYREHVPSKVREYVTHLPRYSIAAAAGPFLENREIESEGWVEVPKGLRLGRGMFVAAVTGRSMEPLIPDGSLCIFRRGVVGSRQGRLVLVEALGSAGDRYTVKRYSSEKTANRDDEGWRHARIRLEPLNPEFAAWYLDPEEDRYRILAEYVQVLD